MSPRWWGRGAVLGKFEEGDEAPQRGSDESFANLARKGFSLLLILKIKGGIKKKNRRSIAFICCTCEAVGTGFPNITGGNSHSPSPAY